MIESDRVDRSLARLRVELSPSGADKARLRSALGLSESAPAASEPAALTRRAALRASGKLGVSLAALVFGAGVAVGSWWRVDRQPEPRARLALEPPASALQAGPTPPSTATPAPEAKPDVAVSPSVSEPARGERARRHARAASAALPKVVVTSPLDAELALLRRVERALRSNDPALAQALLGELDERFPETRLAEERLAARSMADCRLHGPDAAPRARAFLQAHPASVYSERVELACALETTPPGATH